MLKQFNKDSQIEMLKKITMVKRRKRQDSAAGQLSLFEVAPVRREEETRRMSGARQGKRQDGMVGQFAFFATTTPRRAGEVSRRKPGARPVEALKTAAPTLVPPAPVEAVKTPENGLKTETPDRDELNRLWKENPEALRALNRMKEINPYVITLVRALGLVPQENINR